MNQPIKIGDYGKRENQVYGSINSQVSGNNILLINGTFPFFTECTASTIKAIWSTCQYVLIS